ncbi:universal stress protein [Fastidiosibacter lacustris]|uniref:universal stress protein n=1 Tax=Fastidiosibacter lacustris TaxID=2056695 RepID=UPI000E34CEBF|nr:universal stress protein [Fastidiosibacter lacustris]
MFEYKNIIYAINVNDDVEKTLTHLTDYAKQKSAKLHVVTVHKTIFDYGYGAGVSEKTPNQLIKERLAKKFQEVTKKVEKQTYVDCKLIEADSVADGIIEYAQKNKIDLLILNGHHHGILGRMGSVASKIANNAPCDVVILKNV